MIGKIMSEASHSIIGMLSAKPLDMETRTANNEFSSLLLPSEDKSRPTLDISGADKADDNGATQFLDQVIGIDEQPVPPASDTDILKTIAAKISAKSCEGDVELPSDMPPSPVSVSDVERFISAMLPSGTEAMGADELKRVTNYIGEAAGTDIDQKLVNKSANEITNKTGNEIANETDAQKTSVAVNKWSPTLTNPLVSRAMDVASLGSESPVAFKPVAFKPVVEANQLVDSKAMLENGGEAEDSDYSTNGPAKQSSGIDMSKPNLVDTKSADIAQKTPAANMPVAAKSNANAEIVNLSKDISFSGQTPALPVAPQEAGSARKIRDLLDFRLANQRKVETAGSQQAPKFDVGEAVIAADKPMTIETKFSLPKTENLPASGQLEREGEVSTPTQSTPVTGGHFTIAKTVSLDGTAPQFAERLASEIRDITGNGDLKKFEINGKNMGRLEVSLVSRGSSEIIRIEAENEATREMIVQNSQAIQDMLKAQGRSDLTLRVDVRENMFAAPHNNSMNFGQQEAGTNAREEGSVPSQNHETAMPTKSDVDPDPLSDNSRYA
tara:strand:+ start:882 stop:2546 length:1665 start_codon:yes stop_codon:yes gene_type:complete